MSWADLTAVSINVSAKVGQLNRDKGLQNWFRSLGQVGANSAGTGFGGVDVLFLGDSLTRGFFATNPSQDAAVHRFKLMIQNRLNPSGVGGYGFVRSYASDGVSGQDIATLTGSTSLVSNATSLQGNALAGTGTARANRIAWQFNGSGSPDPTKRYQVTDVEFLYVKNSGHATDLRCDISADAAPGSSAGGIFSQTVDASSSSLLVGNRLPKKGLTRTQNIFVQMGSGSSTSPVWVEGLFAYDGDWDRGVRVHNMGQAGAFSGDFAQTSAVLAAHTTQLCQGPNGGAQNTRLVVINLGINDLVQSPQVPLSTVRANLVQLIQAFAAAPTSPAILFVLTPMQGRAAGTAGSGQTQYSAQDLANMVRILASSYPNQVAVLDTVEILGNLYFYNSSTDNAYHAMLDKYSYNGRDNLHYSDQWQPFLANALYQMIVPN